MPGDRVVPMKTKLLMQWNIRSGRDSQYLEFVMREFIPSAARMGLQIVDAWYTLYGDQPEILVAGVVASEQMLSRIMVNPEWEKLLDDLSKHIKDLQKKVVPDQGRFQL